MNKLNRSNVRLLLEETITHVGRRAIWLNPFEPAFNEHLAHCLYKLERYSEPLQAFSKLSENKKIEGDSHIFLRFIEDKLKRGRQKANLCQKMK
jgi:hypothetical protein